MGTGQDEREGGGEAVGHGQDEREGGGEGVGHGQDEREGDGEGVGQGQANDDRRARALARLAELGDEPGGDAFLARMGVLGDWIVDWAFGDVHTRPGLSARERELIIVALLTALGSSDPQVRAHIRALRAIDVPWNEIEETILQTTPYSGIPRAVNAMKVLREEQEAAQ